MKAKAIRKKKCFYSVLQIKQSLIEEHFLDLSYQLGYKKKNKFFLSKRCRKSGIRRRFLFLRYCSQKYGDFKHFYTILNFKKNSERKHFCSVDKGLQRKWRSDDDDYIENDNKSKLHRFIKKSLGYNIDGLVIHHMSHKFDNRNKKLKVMTASEHIEYHKKTKMKYLGVLHINTERELKNFLKRL